MPSKHVIQVRFLSGTLSLAGGLTGAAEEYEMAGDDKLVGAPV